ncbi:hypothetical protein CRENBAI_005011 [Crenichthys baileyi]|uniref:Uncharacterized protein n=1 Tax=Crenichthys baileyi TaxID=28760 RepID=A0AAV9R3D8_9TELE
MDPETRDSGSHHSPSRGPTEQLPRVSKRTPKHPAPDTENHKYTSVQRHQPLAGSVQVPIPQRGNQPPDPGGPIPSGVETGRQHQTRLVPAKPNHMPPNQNAMNPPPHMSSPTDELHPRKADKDTPTQCNLHTRPRSKHHHQILPPTTQRAVTAKQGPCTTPPQPPPTGATEQTPTSTVLTMEPPTPHQDGTN